MSARKYVFFLVTVLAFHPGFSASAQSASSIFLEPPTYGSGGYFAGPMATADVNRDGTPDLVIANRCGTAGTCVNALGPGGVAVLLGNGGGTFQAAVTYSSGGYSAFAIAVADVNGDGKPDIVVVNACGGDSSCANGSVAVLLGNGDGTFQPAVAYPSGGYQTLGLAVADVNGDGKPDLVVTSECLATNGGCSGTTNGIVAVLLGNGDGTFQTAVSLSSGGYYSYGVIAADLNGDGKADLVVSNECAGVNTCALNGSVSVLLGNGDGSFQTPTAYNAGYSPNELAVADVNGDGKPDIVVEDLSGLVGVLLGTGNGTFQPAVFYSSGSANYGSGVAVADVNGDGKPDIVVANGTNNGTVGVLLGNGDGTFQTAAGYSSGGFGARSVAVADVNGDSKPDVVVTIGLSESQPVTGGVAILLGNGDGTLRSASLAASSPGPGLAVGDLNRDGKPDLVVSNWGSNAGTIGVLLGNGNGTFQLEAGYGDAGGPDHSGNFGGSVAVADFNGDGWPDVVAVNPATFDPDGNPLNTNSYVNVFLNQHSGVFASNPPVYYSGGWDDEAVAVADFNGDGVPDIAVSDLYCTLPSGCGGSPPQGVISVLYGAGNGTFSKAVGYFTGSGLYSVVAADVNQDGLPDLVFTTNTSGGSFVEVMLLSPGGVLSTMAYPSGGAPGSFAISAAVADINRDGIPDLIVANGCPALYVGPACSATSSISVLLGNGDGTFGVPITIVVPATVPGTPGIAVADFDGDGNPDVACASGDFLLLGNGDGTFRAPLDLGFNIASLANRGIAAEDFHIDGKPDLALVTDSGVFLLPNISANFTHYATTTSISSATNPAAINQSVTFTAEVAGFNGAIPTGNVTFRIDGGSTTVVALVNGQATYMKAFSTAGVHTVTAAYGGDSGNASSFSATLRQNTTPAVVTISGSPQQPLTTDVNGNFVANVTITNTGNVTASSIQVTSATLGSGSLLSAPAAITNLAPGASAVVTLTFPPNSVPSGATTAPLRVSGTYSVTSPALSGNWALSFRSVTL